ncbi:alpha/beta hydrolase [Bailinhaonella thermotolerans]|uniref:Alpha/beta hydrolase n=2 Tax=Bailinhaonella thermotolerans TaxID=1070861 RepID=A0A3A4AWR2_9ACTN|nr:alpha/beta hydrolase [Bailinhaonella thermotolerans]
MAGRLLLALGVLAAGALVSADLPGDGVSGALRPFYSQRLTWTDCTDVYPMEQEDVNPRVRCAWVKVPVDYGNPGGATADIYVQRYAAGTGDRLGSLFLNFGGPGVSGTEVYLDRDSSHARLANRYDLVSFDPRGTGANKTPECPGGEELDRFVSDDLDGAGWARRTRSFAQKCRLDSDLALPYLGSVNAARDLDVIRAVLGERKTNYLGYSYGGALGAVYASLFPQRVGRMVLDGGYDPTIPVAEQARTLNAAVRRAYAQYIDDCVSRSCPLGATPAAVRRNIDGLLARLEREPLDVKGRRVTRKRAEDAIFAAFYSPEDRWPLSRALADARAGRGEGLLKLADGLYGYVDGEFTTELASRIAITCADTTARPTAREVEEAVDQAAPLEFFPIEADCLDWPEPATPPLTRVGAPGLPPILVVATTGDPVTPWAWGKDLAAKLGPASLLTYQGEGHTAYGANPCVNRAVDGFLLEGGLPAAATCAAGARS